MITTRPVLKRPSPLDFVKLRSVHDELVELCSRSTFDLEDLPRRIRYELARYSGRDTMTDFTRATELTPEVEASIVDAFEYHPWNPDQIKAGADVRAAGVAFVKVLIACVPPGPDRSSAIRKIREARMDANSAITHGGKY